MSTSVVHGKLRCTDDVTIRGANVTPLIGMWRAQFVSSGQRLNWQGLNYFSAPSEYFTPSTTQLTFNVTGTYRAMYKIEVTDTDLNNNNFPTVYIDLEPILCTMPTGAFDGGQVFTGWQYLHKNAGQTTECYLDTFYAGPVTITIEIERILPVSGPG